MRTIVFLRPLAALVLITASVSVNVSISISITRQLYRQFTLKTAP